jgi:hypothetical protein
MSRVVRDVEAPIFVGGSGGSGTRAVAGMLQALGVYMGWWMNAERDAVPLGRFDTFWGPRYVEGRASERLMRMQHDVALLMHLRARRPPTSLWGWKHPQGYLQLPFLAERFPGMRFIHVIRDGRDIALSENQNQLRLYGHHLLRTGPPWSLSDRARYWAVANARAADDAESLGISHLLVRLEDLCDDTRTQTERLRRFVGAPNGQGAERAADVVARPPTLGRWRSLPEAEQLELEQRAGPALRRFGYVRAPLGSREARG